MTPYNRIFALRNQGFNFSQIESKTNCTRKTIRNVFKLAAENNFTFSADALSDLEIHRLLHAKNKRTENYLIPSADQVSFCQGLPGYSVNKMYQDYLADCAVSGNDHYSRAQFYNIINAKKGASLPFIGRMCMIFLPNVYETDNAKKSLLLAYHEYSHHFIFVDMDDLKPRSWIHAHNQIFSMAGIPEEIVYLKSLKKDFVSATREMLNFYNIPYTLDPPRIPEKKSLLSAIRTCTDPADVCRMFNSCPWNTDPTFSKEDAFQLELETYSIPDIFFDLHEVIDAKVQIDFHMAVDRNYYSVPFYLRHEKLQACCTDRKVLIVYNDQVVAEHRRLSGKYRYSTLPEHMPDDADIPFNEVSANKLLSRARLIGPYTHQLIQRDLNAVKYTPQAFRLCMSTLQLAKTYSRYRLEKASEQVLAAYQNPQAKIPLRIVRKSC